MKNAIRLGLSVVLGAGLLGGVVTDANAARVKGNTIALSGCTQFRVPFCTVVVSGGKAYSLIDAVPPIPYNVGVTLVGQKVGDVGPCFAPTIKVLKWKRNRLHCPVN